MAFLLLILATALVFNRPGDWIPSLEGLPLFQVVILSSLAIGLSQCMSHLRLATAARTPITICVAALLGVTAASNLLNPTGSLDFSVGLVKAAIFYLLTVSLVDSRERISHFITAVGLSIFLVGLTMVVSFHTGMFGETQHIMSGDGVRVEALGGVHFDANDTAALLVLSTLIFLAKAIDGTSVAFRLISIALAVVSLHGLQLANSRAGFLSLVLGTITYVWCRWGMKGLRWGMPLIVLGAGLVATDRMADFGAIQTGTGQSRLQFSSMGLSIFFRNPLLGIGPGEYVSRIGKACHNSFVQAYAELGILGGALFAAAFYLGLRMSLQLAVQHSYERETDEEATLEPTLYLIPALFVSYMFSILTLNHLYGCHTYLLLALATVATLVYEQNLDNEVEHKPVFEGSLLAKLGTVSGAFIIGMYLICLVFVHW
jgi:O-antigen ligase